LNAETAAAAESFTRLAQQSSGLLDELGACLEAELQALQQHDLEALRLATGTKQQRLEQFSGLNHERQTLLTGLGIAANADAVQGWLNGLPAPARDPAATAWQQLQQALTEISRLNLRNEQVILRNSRNTDQLLSLLRGQSPQQSLYNAAGTKGPAAAQNRLGKA